MSDTPTLAAARALAAEAKVRAAAARVEDVAELIGHGLGAAAVAQRTGTTEAGLYRALYRAGRLDLWRAARRAEGATGVRGDQRLALA